MLERLANVQTPPGGSLIVTATIATAELKTGETKVKTSKAAPAELQEGQFRALICQIVAGKVEPGGEYVLVTAGQEGTEWTIERGEGVDGSPEANHPIGSSILAVSTAGQVSNYLTERLIPGGPAVIQSALGNDVATITLPQKVTPGSALIAVWICELGATSKCNEIKGGGVTWKKIAENFGTEGNDCNQSVWIGLNSVGTEPSPVIECVGTTPLQETWEVIEVSGVVGVDTFATVNHGEIGAKAELTVPALTFGHINGGPKLVLSFFSGTQELTALPAGQTGYVSLEGIKQGQSGKGELFLGLPAEPPTLKFLNKGSVTAKYSAISISFTMQLLGSAQLDTNGRLPLNQLPASKATTPGAGVVMGRNPFLFTELSYNESDEEPAPGFLMLGVCPESIYPTRKFPPASGGVIAAQTFETPITLLSRGATKIKPVLADPLTSNTAIGAKVFNMTGSGGKGYANAKTVKFAKLSAGVTTPKTGKTYFIVGEKVSGFELSETEGGAAITVAGAAVEPATTELVHALSGETAIGATALKMPWAKAQKWQTTRFVQFKALTPGVTTPEVGRVYYIVNESAGVLEIGESEGGPALKVAGHAIEPGSTEIARVGTLPAGSSVVTLPTSPGRPTRTMRFPVAVAPEELLPYTLAANVAVNGKVFEVTGAKGKGLTNGKRIVFPSLTAGVTNPKTATAFASGEHGTAVDTPGKAYYIVGEKENGFELSETDGGTAIKVEGAELLTASSSIARAMYLPSRGMIGAIGPSGVLRLNSPVIEGEVIFLENLYIPLT